MRHFLFLVICLALFTSKTEVHSRKAEEPVTIGPKRFEAIYRLPWLNMTVMKLDPDGVDNICGDMVNHWDNGQPVLPGQHFAGCTSVIRHKLTRNKTLIVVRWDEEGAKALIHELCHAGGLPPDIVDTVDWDNAPGSR